MRSILLLTMSLVAAGCSSPTAPDSRTGFMGLRATCDDTGSSQLICVAQTYCAGLYRCPDPRGDNADVTANAQWTIDDSSIIRQGSQANWFTAVAPGHTVVRVRSALAATEATVRLGVFPGISVPRLTTEVWGRVSEAGTTPAAGISGAVVEMTGGLVGSRTMTTGSSPAFIPGYFFDLRGPDGYQFFGIPRGTYEVTVRAPGYAPKTQTVTVDPPGSPSLMFQLDRVTAGPP
jgi:hypothetical protein